MNRISPVAPTAVPPNAVIEIRTGHGPAVRIGNALRLSIIAGPCQMESRAHALETLSRCLVGLVGVTLNKVGVGPCVGG